MKAYTLSMVVTLFVSAEAAKPRSVNVALETVFEFENTSDIEFLNTIQNFISKVKDVIVENPDQSGPTRRRERYKFTDFLENLIITLNTFNDNALKEVIQTVDTEIRKAKHTDTLKTDIKELLLNKLDGVNINSAKNIRKNFDNLLKKLKSSKDDKNSYFLGFINTLYKKASERKLTNFIRKLKILRRSNRKSKDLQKTIQKAVQLIIFDHFSKLSPDIESMIQSQIEDYVKDDNLRGDNNKNIVEYDKIKPKIKLQNYEGHKLVKRKEKIKSIRNTIAVKTYPRIKSTHITLYPETSDNDSMMANYRAKSLVTRNSQPKDVKNLYKYQAIVPPHNIKLESAKNENIPTDGVALSSISQSTEINVNFISNRDENNEIYRPIKIRASSFKTKNHRTTKSNKRLKYGRQYQRNKIEFYSTPETLVEQFGSLYKSEASKIVTQRSPTNYMTNKPKWNKETEEKEKDFKENKFVNTANSQIVNIAKRYTTENTEQNSSAIQNKPSIASNSWSKNNNVSKLDWYRRADEFGESKDVNIKKNNSDIARGEIDNTDINVSKLLEWYRRAKTDSLKEYENITEKRNTEINRSKNTITSVVISKNGGITKSDWFRRANELNHLKENIKLATKFENITNENNTTNDLLNYETNEIKRSTKINKVISDFTENDIVNEIHANITELKGDVKENNRKSLLDVNKNVLINTKVNKLNTDRKIVDSTSKNATFETKTTNQVNLSFDINNFIKNSDVRNIEDEEKKKEVERKIKQDLEKLFASPTTNATTEAYTDIFQALDDAFDLGPLK